MAQICAGMAAIMALNCRLTRLDWACIKLINVRRLVWDTIMAQGKFITYLRVSTDKQGKSGLGIEAQRAAVSAYLNGGDWQLCGEYVEIESGKKSNRPKLAEAMLACRQHRATLLIAKLDRLSRDLHFLSGLEKSGVDFVAADMPHAGKVTVRIMAVLAEDELERISARTKAALAAAKARGTVLGGDRGYRITNAAREAGIAAVKAKANARNLDLLPIIKEMQASGAGLREIARELSAKGIPTARGLATWTPTAVSRVIAASA